MTYIRKTLTVEDKLRLLSEDSRFDLACACAPRPDEHRRRSEEGRWIYPVSLPQGGRTYIFKTLLSNACRNDCTYCPLRSDGNVRRLTLSPEELASSFMTYYRRRRVSGLFISSGVCASPDETMERINRTARILREKNFRGYIHLKVIPGASESAIRESLSLASAVSLNIEAPGEEHFSRLSRRKRFDTDIITPLTLISRLRREGDRRLRRIKQTTQFVVGAAGESDRDIITRAGSLYSDMKLNRIYFSAYQPPREECDLFGDHLRTPSRENHARLTREHRLYQVDWLMRKYGFSAEEIPVDEKGSLSLDKDPKEMWALSHPEYFPVNLNKAGRTRLLRVPGFGEVTVERVLSLRAEKTRLRRLSDLGKVTKRLRKALPYVCF